MSMNYTASCARYVFKNFFYIVLLSVLPAACFSMITCLHDSNAFYLAFFTGDTASITWSQIFNTFSIIRLEPAAVVYSGLGIFASILADIITLLVVVLCAAMLLAILDKHMRIGKRTLNGIFGKINDNLLSTLFMTLLFVFLYELFALVFSSIAILIFSAVAYKPVQYVLVCFALIVTLGALLYVVALLYLWLPCMQVTGFRMFEALRYSNQITEKNKRRIISSMALSLLVGNLFVIPAVMFLSYGAYIVKFVVYAFFFMTFIVRMEIAYFDAAQIEREDLKKRFGEEKNIFEE